MTSPGLEITDAATCSLSHQEPPRLGDLCLHQADPSERLRQLVRGPGFMVLMVTITAWGVKDGAKGQREPTEMQAVHWETATEGGEGLRLDE